VYPARATAAFYVPDGDGYVATEHTRGPWSPKHQHGGPPAALIAHVVQGVAPALSIARVTVDFLRPVPIDRVVVRVESLRAGAKVQRFGATLLHAEIAVARATLTLVRPTGVDVPTVRDDEPLPPPERSAPFQFPFFHESHGYHTAMESRLALGTFGRGRVAMWMRQRVPLLPGAAPSPAERVLVAADTGSGVSAAIEHTRHSAINFDLTVALHRPLEGEWVGLDSVSIYEPVGVGLADTRVVDMRGPVGRVLQGLVIERRPDTR
jgi:acyl-Coa thioesterase superfamily protein/acyl-CoA thioesterase superfamily protein